MLENGNCMWMGTVLLDCETQFVACFNLMEPTVGLCSHFNFTTHSKNIIANKLLTDHSVFPDMALFCLLASSVHVYNC